MNMGFDPNGGTPIHENNDTCIEWGNNVIGGRERAKHLDIQKHFAHEVIQNGHIRLVRVDTANKLADRMSSPRACSRRNLQPACQVSFAGNGVRKGRRDSREESHSACDKSSHVNPYEGCFVYSVIKGKSDYLACRTGPSESSGVMNRARTGTLGGAGQA
jgi:hypothetical protein